MSKRLKRSSFFVILIALTAVFFAPRIFAVDTAALAGDERTRLFEGATLTEADYVPPICATADSNPLYGERVGHDIEIYEDDDGSYYLFLPSSAVLNAVKLRYNGDFELYNEENGELFPTETVIYRDLSGGSFRFYEYDKGRNAFIVHSITVMKGENNAAVYIELTDGDAALKRINSSHYDTESGHILVADLDGSLIYNGELTRMKGHGLTSYDGSGRLNTKNSYNINIGDKTELIDGAGKSKKWSMLRVRTNGNYDATGMSYPIGFYIFDALVGPDYFNMTCRFVDVYINGEYRGVYILTERMDINGSMQVTDLEESTICENPQYTSVSGGKKKTDPLIKAGIQSYSYCKNAVMAEGETDITGGYVLEIMCNTYGECGFLTREGMFINIKSPDCATKEQVQYIAGYVQEFEDALFSETGFNSLGKHYTEYCDLRSYAAQTLSYAFCLNWEIYRTSTYIHKDTDGQSHSVLTFGPAWDFETGPNVMNSDTTLFGQTFAYNEHQQYIWFEQLWKKAAFMSYISSVNDSLKEVLDIMLGKTDGTRIFNLAQLSNSIKASQLMNWIRWKQPDTFESRASSMRKSVATRYSSWFDGVWNDDKYLTGADISVKADGGGGYTFTCSVRGKAESYQWYRANDALTGGTVIAGANSESYTGGEGVYYCAVKGQNNAYWAGASGSIFSSRSITMFTDPIDTSGAISTLTPSLYELGEEPEKIEKVEAETALYADDYKEASEIFTSAQSMTDESDGAETKSSSNNTGYIVVAVICVTLSLTAAVIFGYFKLGGGKDA